MQDDNIILHFFMIFLFLQKTFETDLSVSFEIFRFEAGMLHLKQRSIALILFS
jgi:hypothetical protein